MSLIPTEQDRPTTVGPNEEFAADAADESARASAAAVRAAQAAIAAKNNVSAEALLRERLDAEPADARALVVYGGLLIRLNRLADAQSALERARAADAAWPEPVVLLCRLGLLDQNEALSTEMARELLTKWPSDLRAVDGAVKSLRAAGFTKEAVEALRRLSDLRPALVTPLLKLAELLLASGDVAGAAIAAENAVSRAPRDPRTHHARVDVAVASKEAARIEKAGLAAVDVDARIAARAVTALVRLEDTAKAAHIATMLPAGTFPDSFVKAIVELQKQQLRAAEQRGDDGLVGHLARSILRAQPNDGPSATALKRLMLAARDAARQALAAGRISVAVEQFERAHGYAPDRVALLEEAAKALEQDQDWARASQLWLRAAQAGSGSTAARRAVRAATRAEDEHALLLAWASVVRLEPESEDAAERLTRSVSRMVKLMRQAAVEGREDEALKLADAILAAAPDEPRAVRVRRVIAAHRLRALRAARRERDAEAIDALAQSLVEVDADNVDALRALARLRHLDGRHHEAYDLYVKLRAAAPDDERVEAALQELKSSIRA